MGYHIHLGEPAYSQIEHEARNKIVYETKARAAEPHSTMRLPHLSLYQNSTGLAALEVDPRSSTDTGYNLLNINENDTGYRLGTSEAITRHDKPALTTKAETLSAMLENLH